MYINLGFRGTAMSASPQVSFFKAYVPGLPTDACFGSLGPERTTLGAELGMNYVAYCFMRVLVILKVI